MTKQAKPFLKWVGGKSQLIEVIQDRYPESIGEQIDKYCEPFVGGGAVLFDLLNRYDFSKVLINDINQDLVNAYIQIRNNSQALISRLAELQDEFHTANDEIRKQIYYSVRDRFNALDVKEDNDKIEKASLLIFLNKTCFNGLYRVNRKGEFNVPMGAYKNPLICDKENIEAVSELLQNVEIRCSDYKETLDFIDADTFVYIDPPYRPISKTASFTAYASGGFGDKEQIELRDYVNEINTRGTRTLISNSDPKNENREDDFFDRLYRRYQIDRVPAKRMINSDATKRGAINELLISNGG